MDIEAFVDLLTKWGIDFYTGVPDSLLSALPNYLINSPQIRPSQHVIAHNEGGCVALAAGYHMATGKVPCVYLQNSGVGNIANPVASLTHPKVYGIPILYVIGWRGEPGVKDEPQHIFQGEATLRMLETLELETAVLDMSATQDELSNILQRFSKSFTSGKSAALVVRKNALKGGPNGKYHNSYTINREQAVQAVAAVAGNGVLVATTGKISRELFEHRARQQEAHNRDFLTVGSMGHSSMIALGIAREKPGQRIWCLDGDGAVLMHMGAIAIIGTQKPENLVHVVLNNAAHESVGGVPTAAGKIDLAAVARSCGYRQCFSAATAQELETALVQCTDAAGPVLLEIKVALGSREDLGRPTTTPTENKQSFMNYLDKR